MKFVRIDLYAGILAFFALVLPRIFSLALSITMIVGHSEAAFVWLTCRFGFSGWTHVFYGPAVALVIIYTCRTQYETTLTKENR